MVTVGLLEHPVTEAIRSKGTARYRYSKVDRVSLKYVIADFYPDGREEFADQFLGEFRWHSFTPCAAERHAVLSQCAPNVPGRWPRLCFMNSHVAG
jgi:hypothetical protein